MCLASHEYPPETEWGGIAAYSYYLSVALARKGHEVHVIAMSERKEKDFMNESVYIHVIKYKKRISGGFWNQLNYSWKVYKTVNRLMKEYSIEIMECPDYYTEGFFSSRINTVPLIVKSHNPIFVLSQIERTGFLISLDNTLISKLEKSQIKSADKVTACSSALAKIISKQCSIDPNQIKVIHNGINMQLFDEIGEDMSFRSRYGIRDTDIMVLYLGRLERIKGVYILAEVIPRIFKAFSNVFFVFVGKDKTEGTYERYMKRMVGKRYENRIIFTGALFGTNKIKVIKSCDFMVVPSLWENFPYVCLEAMTCNKPVIGTINGGIKEMIVHGENGLLFNPNRINELEKLIGLLVKNKEIRVRLGENARKTVEMNFSDEIMADKTMKLYKEVLSS